MRDTGANSGFNQVEIIGLDTFLGLMMALLAAIATFMAWLAAYESKKAARGALVSSLLDDYFSDEYLRAAKTIREWKNDNKKDFALIFARQRDKRSKLTKEKRKELDRLDSARRIVKSQFRKAQQLRERKYISKNDILKTLCPPHRTIILFEIIEPLDLAINKQYKRDVYDFLD